MRIKNMPKFITGLTIIFVIISFIMNMLFYKVFSHETPKYQSVVVCQGETLWSIARDLEGNINENIYNIKKLNNLKSSSLYIGQELIIPVYNSEF